jgi:hypothetical protein
MGEVPHHVASPRGTLDDATAGRHSQDRIWSTNLWVEDSQSALDPLNTIRLGVGPLEVPGYGYTIIKRADLVDLRPQEPGVETVVENQFHRLTFNAVSGGGTSWVEKASGHEWVDQAAGYPLNGFVFEEVADKDMLWPRWEIFYMQWDSDEVERARGWKPGWRANRLQPSTVLTHHVYRTPFGSRVIQILKAPGITGSLVQSVFLPDHEEYVEFESWWVMGQSVHPESTYVVFPFNIPGASARIDLGGETMTAGKDQIPGVCCDYFTAQQFVDLSNQERGVTVALPENPMVQFGDFHFGQNQQEFKLERAMLLGWVTNTFWETNFRAHQPGSVHALYRVYPHLGSFDPVRAQRQGLDTAYSQPLLQHMGEPRAKALFPPTGQLLRLPETLDPAQPVFTLHVKPARTGSGLVVRLYNAGDTPQMARIGSGLQRITAAGLCDLSENAIQPLLVTDGDIRVQIPAHQVTTLRLEVR